MSLFAGIKWDQIGTNAGNKDEEAKVKSGKSSKRKRAESI